MGAEKCIQNLVGKPEHRRFERDALDGRTILRWILRKQDAEIQIGFTCLRMCFSDRLL
jgi:hypothetical protein